MTTAGGADQRPGTIFTVGHSTRALEEFVALVRSFGVDCLVDIRSIPRSRRNPQFNTEVLAAALPEAGIRYRHIRELGGRRGRQKEMAQSPNALWRHEAFRNYADHALAPAFAGGLGTLLSVAGSHTAAMMCAEALWWRCHRRIVADYLLVRGCRVIHIVGPEKSEPATLTPGAEPQPDGTILYPASSPELPL